ncbi:MAG: hypothetical protein KGH72_02085 [Candidatus Micrarchaeota archaeon]|nr:hypothetical protein [Candidatus Micrarchaeota archaeon]
MPQRRAADPHTRYNAAVLALPRALRDRFLEDAGRGTRRVIRPDDPVSALQEVLRLGGNTGEAIDRHQQPKPITESTPHFMQPTDTMDYFWRMQGWVNEDGTLAGANWADSPESTRIAAVRFLVEKVLKKDPRGVTARDFSSNRLWGLLKCYYQGSPYAAISEAFQELDIREWEMATTPRSFFKSADNRVAAVRWLVGKLGIDPRDIAREDFYSNRLSGLFTHHYNSSPYGALLEAGLVGAEDEHMMRSRRYFGWR